MFSNTQAGRALQDGCTRLGLPQSTATELMGFLSVKRKHDHYVKESKRVLRMSPGAKLDRLWHFMLLNTSVSTAVHDQLGGVVEHRGIDSTDLSDESKLLQRLYALNVMRLEGHEPDLELWTEPGTAMHKLCTTSAVVPALQHLPGGGRLLTTPRLSQQLRAQLVQALQLLYSDDDTTCDSNMQQVRSPQPTEPRTTRGGRAAAAVAVASRPPTGAAKANAKCPADDMVKSSKHQQQQHQQVPALELGVLNIKVVRVWDGRELLFKVKTTTRIERVAEGVEKAWRLERASYRLLFDGQRVQLDATPLDLEMEEGDALLLLKQQCGC